MRLTKSKRILTCAAIAGSTAFAVALPAGTAWAKPLASTTCKTFSGSSVTGKDVITISGCADTVDTGGGTGTGVQTTSTLDIKWHNAKTSNVSFKSTYTTSAASLKTCPKDGTLKPVALVTETGTVKSGTLFVKSVFSSKQCVYFNSKRQVFQKGVAPFKI
jgi:hypothetical protein